MSRIARTLLLTAGTILFFSSMSLCADYPGKAPAEEKTVQKKTPEQNLQDLQKQKKALIAERQQLKRKLLRNDTRLKRKREQLIRVAKNLSLELDLNPQVRNLNEKINSLDRQIRELTPAKTAKK